MKNWLALLLILAALPGCHKGEDKAPSSNSCDMEKVYTENAKKTAFITGAWGTISSMEGNCMPTTNFITSCRHCPARRTVKIFAYTREADATPSPGSRGFYDSFNTPLIAETETDEDGFFQVNIPPGQYSIVIVENGKLYANGVDGDGGINPFTYSSGLLKVNVAMTYKAVF